MKSIRINDDNMSACNCSRQDHDCSKCYSTRGFIFVETGYSPTVVDYTSYEENMMSLVEWAKSLSGEMRTLDSDELEYLKRKEKT